jgi:hypothetical protein
LRSLLGAQFPKRPLRLSFRGCQFEAF